MGVARRSVTAVAEPTVIAVDWSGCAPSAGDLARGGAATAWSSRVGPVADARGSDRRRRRPRLADHRGLRLLVQRARLVRDRARVRHRRADLGAGRGRRRALAPPDPAVLAGALRRSARPPVPPLRRPVPDGEVGVPAGRRRSGRRRFGARHAAARVAAGRRLRDLALRRRRPPHRARDLSERAPPARCRIPPRSRLNSSPRTTNATRCARPSCSGSTGTKSPASTRRATR